MLNIQRASTITREDQDHDDEEQIRDIHALTPPRPPSEPANPPRRREAWEASRSSSLSIVSEGGASSNENFTTMSGEFNALVLAGSSMENNNNNNNNDNEPAGPTNLARIGEEAEVLEETNPLAIVADNNPLPSPRGVSSIGGSNLLSNTNDHGEVLVQRVKREEVQTKISAWQTAKIAKINNRFKREDAIINGWEGAQVQKATSWMKKVERKLEEKRAKALEKMQNDVARAHRKAEEKRASAEAKRGTKVARVLEVANLMKAVGRPPVKRSFF